MYQVLRRKGGCILQGSLHVKHQVKPVRFGGRHVLYQIVNLSYAAKAEGSANKIYYGEDHTIIARHMDFMVPMTYFSEYSSRQDNPGSTGAWAKETAEVIWQGNPQCQVYAAVSTFGMGYSSYVAQAYEKALAAGKISKAEKQRHLLTGNDWEARASLEWLKRKRVLPLSEIKETSKILEKGICTAAEVMVAVKSVREAGLKGIMFFPHHTMWKSYGGSVLGREELSACLKQAFAEPAELPHRRQSKE